MKLLSASIRELTEAYEDSLKRGDFELARFWRLVLTERLLQLANSIGTEQSARRNDTGEL
jgi:hypothetical protein